MQRVVWMLLLAAPISAAEREYPPLPKPVNSFGAVSSDGFVYVYGGHSGKEHKYTTETTLGQFLRLSIANPAKWEELPSGPISQGSALVAHDGKIYRIGGMQPRSKPAEKEDNHSLASVARFDPAAPKWEDLPEMPAGRSSHDAAVLGDKIYVAGGWNMKGAGKDSEWHATALVLDLKKQPLKWAEFEQPFKRRALTMASFDGKIYVIGGLNPEGEMERTVNVYDPEKKTWSKAADVPGEGLNGFTPAACVCDGKLYINPADGNFYGLSEKGTWDNVAAIKQGRIVHRIVPIGKNQILVIGGSAKGSIVGSVEAVEVGK